MTLEGWGIHRDLPYFGDYFLEYGLSPDTEIF